MLFLLLQVVALEGATVHSMVPGAEPAVATVLVEDGAITAVGPDLEIPEGAQRVDLSGKHLVPGLIDGMANHDPEHDPLHTSAGVLLVRDAGNDLDRITTAKVTGQRPNGIGPDLMTCGLVFDGQPPATTNSVVVRGPDDVEAKLEALLEWDIDYIGTHTGIPAEAWRALIVGAHEAGLQVWGPKPAAVPLSEIAAAGQDGLFFLDVFVPADLESGVLTAEEIAEHARVMEQSGLALTPVLRAYGRYLDDGDDADLSLLSPTYEMQWQSERAGRERFATEEFEAGLRRRMDSQRRLLLALHEAGVELVPGSGAPHPWLMPGTGLHDELAEWKVAGIPDADILHAVTRGAARTLGVEERYGSIEVGRRANLVAVSGDPREDIGVLRTPAGICLRGRWFDGQELLRWRQGVGEYQAGVRTALDEPIEVDEPELPEGSAKVLAGTAETRVFGIRTAVERFVVARQSDGRLAYAVRRRVPHGLGMPDAETTLLQIMDGDQLGKFTLTVTSGGTEYLVEGVRIGGQFRIERRVDGAQVDTNSTQRRPLFVDVGTVLPAMILAKHRGAGASTVLYFEGMDPAVDTWNAELRENGLFVAATPSGGIVAALNADGSVAKCQRQRGNDMERTETIEVTTFGGPGLALPVERVFRGAPEGQPTDAGAKQDEQPKPEPEGPTVR